MSNNQILKPTDKFDLNKVTFSTLKTNKFGGKLCYLNYNRAPLRIQTPKMALPFGVSKWESTPGSSTYKYLMEFSFNDYNNGDNKMKTFYENIKAIENKVKNEAETQSVAWFKKKQSRELIDEFFKSQVKVSLDKDGEESDKYPPRLRSKVIHSEQDGFKIDVYDSEKNEDGEYERLVLDKDNLEETIPRGSKAVAILECTGIWFVEKSFGISWKVAQVKVFKNQNKLSGFCLEDEEETDETENVENVKDEVENKTETKITKEESEDEEDKTELPEKEQQEEDQTETQEETQEESQEEDVKVIDVPKKKSMKKTK